MKKMKITLYSHFFKVTKIHPSTYLALRKAIDELVQRSFVKIRGKWVQQSVKVFAARTTDGSEYRFHINYLPRFKEIIRGWGIKDDEIDYEECALFDTGDVVLKTDEKFVLRDYQQACIEYMLEDGSTKLITLQTGKGKFLPFNTPIKIPNGWKRIGDLQLGDYVNTPNGDKAKVIGIYDNEPQPGYRLTFADGRVIECCKDHLWDVFSWNFRCDGKEGVYKTLNTQEIYDIYLASKLKGLGKCKHDSKTNVNTRLYIPLVDPTHSADEDVDLPLDPYLLGVILGDGCISSGNRVTITKPDLWLKDEVTRIVKEYECEIKVCKPYISDDGKEKCLNYSINSINNSRSNAVVSIIRYLGLSGKRSWEKFIPEIYLNASFDQRLALIQGLMDTDGTVSGGSVMEYSTTSEELANNVQYLARSLGAQCTVSSRYTHYTYKGYKYKGRLNYRVRIRAQIPSMFFKTPIKKDRCKDVNQYTIKGMRLRIKTMEPIGLISGRCIAVDHPDNLYITNHFIVTHNTFTAAKFGEVYKKRILVMVLARYKEKWVQDIKGLYGEKVKIISIDTLVQFLQLLEKHEENKEGLPDVFIVSTSIMQRYISEWEKHQGREIEGMIPPEQIYERLDIGYRLIDEAHQHFHFVFKNDLYTHCAKCVYLTATLNSNERFLNAMYELVWPTKIRTKTLAYEAYDNVIALYYQHNAPERVRCKGQQGYSHILYEQSIFRHIPSQCQYLDMIGDQVEQHFLPIYDEGKRMLIFCSLVDTCEKVSSYLNKRFKDQKWKISKFVAGDNKEIIDTNDITVSTLGKAGTALDIDGLVVVLNTVALSEPKANIQAKGRNRNLTKRPGFEHITPKFIYFVGTDIPKHIEYHRAKRRLFAELTLAQYEQPTGYTIGIPLHEYLPRYGDNNHRYDMWGVKPYSGKKK